MDASALEPILKALKSHGVKSFKSSDLILEFYPNSPVEPQPAEDPLSGLKGQENSLPPDLRTDSIHDHDKILNWSAPPSGEEASLPLVDDLPLIEP